MDKAVLEGAIRTIPDFPSPGIQFKDITPILADAGLLKGMVELLAEPYERQRITKVVGIESRGFILGSLLACHLQAGFVPVRKEGKLPYETVRCSYDLEYGTDVLEMHVDAIEPEDRVLIHDDVIATGGTARATYDLVSTQEGDVVGFSFLVELMALEGRQQLEEGVPVHSVLRLQTSNE